MRPCTAFALTLILTTTTQPLPCWAGPEEDARARAALAIAAARHNSKYLVSVCNCNGPADCTCPPGTCVCGACATKSKSTGKVCYCDDPANCPCDGDCTCIPTAARSKGTLYLIYSNARAAAIRQGAPMLVWVGTVCPPCEQKMQEYIHYRCSTFDGDSTPRVIVSVPKDGELYEARVFTEEIPTPDDVRAAIALFDNKYRRVTTQQARPASASAYTYPQLFAPPPAPMLMMGGFGGGGGCFGGGCGGGG